MDYFSFRFHFFFLFDIVVLEVLADYFSLYATVFDIVVFEDLPDYFSLYATVFDIVVFEDLPDYFFSIFLIFFEINEVFESTIEFIYVLIFSDILGFWDIALFVIMDDVYTKFAGLSSLFYNAYFQALLICYGAWCIFLILFVFGDIFVFIKKCRKLFNELFNVIFDVFENLNLYILAANTQLYNNIKSLPRPLFFFRKLNVLNYSYYTDIFLIFLYSLFFKFSNFFYKKPRVYFRLKSRDLYLNYFSYDYFNFNYFFFGLSSA